MVTRHRRSHLRSFHTLAMLCRSRTSFLRCVSTVTNANKENTLFISTVPPERQLFIHPKLCTNQRQQSPKPALSLRPARAGCTSCWALALQGKPPLNAPPHLESPHRGLELILKPETALPPTAHLGRHMWKDSCSESHRARLGPLQCHHRQM